MPGDTQHIAYEQAQRVLDETAIYRRSVPSPDAPAAAPKWYSTHSITMSGPTRGYAFLGRSVHNATISGAGRWGSQFVRSLDTKGVSLHDTPYANAWRDATFGGMRRATAIIRSGARELEAGNTLKGVAKLGAGGGRLLLSLGLEQVLKGCVLIAAQALRQAGRALRIVDTESKTNRLADRLDSRDDQRARRKAALRDCMLAIAKTYPNGDKDLALAKLQTALESDEGTIRIGDAEIIARCLNSSDSGYNEEDIKSEIASTLGRSTAPSVLKKHGLDHEALKRVSGASDGDWISVEQGSDGFKTSNTKILGSLSRTARGGEFVQAAMLAKYGDSRLSQTSMTSHGQGTVLDFLASRDRFTVGEFRAMEKALDSQG